MALQNTNTASFLEEGANVTLTATENRIKIDVSTLTIDQKIDYLATLLRKVLVEYSVNDGLPISDPDLIDELNKGLNGQTTF